MDEGKDEGRIGDVGTADVIGGGRMKRPRDPYLRKGRPTVNPDACMAVSVNTAIARFINSALKSSLDGG